MQPTHAEVARTLAAGHLPATAHIACRPGPLPVRHVTDAHGRVLLLSPRDGAVTAALSPAPGTDDTALVLDISDVPPVAGAPSLGRVWVSGWATLLAGDEARQAALDYADSDPASDLLDVGTTQVIHRMDVAEVRYERHGVLVEVDPDEFAEAEPDPLRAIEFDLITDLADHHVEEMAGYVRRQLGPAARPGDEPRVVRLDRYGFLVRLGARLARLSFPRPVADRHDLAHLLHPVLCGRCAHRDEAA
ncbi:DUF2470 domain-containing protein [Couchioplanes caeruleus]|uniref:DUF2470 domain-containing protein n=2 Tax=Couchioplanes caeruleus TaxID=56438 RepID=A0A1K0FKA1_9ACTN|nr:DUF2470 domain-containing protein [Couchioplanes caeruleus]OJF13285.1 DUF2470 domain-containing protein [Couchioplanes caeruleus subsp. caeruleus]ROP29167.1 hypothetical protein EDD30_1952 [Couchioplanes caeruleus]